MSAAVSSESPLVPGFRLDRYELLCPVAQGGMAAVWLARMKGKHGFEKIVAIKMILHTHAEAPQFRSMFLDEATIASRIEHNNVAQILDLGEHEGTLFLVMEWVDGDSVSQLDRAVQKTGALLPLRVVLRIAVDACSGLHAAHELRDRSGQDLNVVHRDVSPQNILVSEQGVVKVIDFGIAKARDRVSEETSSGSLKGKIHYMAPEQALGKRVDRRADVWAVGAVLYRLLARRPVYDGENQLEILHHLTTNQPLRPLPDDVPPSVARVVAVALAFDPDQRYESCAELRDALEATISAENLPCSAHELGTFVHQFLGERLEGRRQTLQAALRAASERPSAHQLRSSEVEGGLEPQPAAARPLSSAPIEGSLTSSSTALDAPPPRAGGHTFAWLALGAGLAAAAAVGVALTQQHTEPPAGAALGSATTIHAPLAPVALPSNEPLVTASAAQPSPQPSAASTVALKPKPVGVIAKPAALAPRAKPKRKAVNDGF